MGLYMCAASCMVLSIWAIIQLVLMGISYTIEASTMIEDVEPHEGTYTDYNDFISQAKNNYALQARNCYVVAGIYVLALILSYWGLRHARKVEKREALKREDDEYFCRQRDNKVKL